VNLTRRSLYPPEDELLCPLNRRLGGPSCQPGHFGEDVSPCCNLNFDLPAHNLVAISTTLPVLHYRYAYTS
jgi:hypothetical protein